MPVFCDRKDVVTTDTPAFDALAPAGGRKAHHSYLIFPSVGRSVAFGGVETSGEPKGGRSPRQCGLCHARTLGMDPLWREGGEYNIRKENKPARSLISFWSAPSGFYPPATSAVVESLSGGAFERHQKGFYNDQAGKCAQPCAPAPGCRHRAIPGPLSPSHPFTDVACAARSELPRGSDPCGLCRFGTVGRQSRYHSCQLERALSHEDRFRNDPASRRPDHGGGWGTAYPRHASGHPAGLCRTPADTPVDQAQYGASSGTWDHRTTWYDDRDGQGCAARDHGIPADQATGPVPDSQIPDRPAQHRPCMRCGKQMLSMGPHHRMCSTCRAKPEGA